MVCSIYILLSNQKSLAATATYPALIDIEQAMVGWSSVYFEEIPDFVKSAILHTNTLTPTYIHKYSHIHPYRTD